MDASIIADARPVACQSCAQIDFGESEKVLNEVAPTLDKNRVHFV